MNVKFIHLVKKSRRQFSVSEFCAGGDEVLNTFNLITSSTVRQYLKKYRALNSKGPWHV